jgi:hypothetical protein
MQQDSIFDILYLKPVIGLFHELASVSLNRDMDKKNHHSVSDGSMATINMHISIEALIMFSCIMNSHARS